MSREDRGVQEGWEGGWENRVGMTNSDHLLGGCQSGSFGERVFYPALNPTPIVITH